MIARRDGGWVGTCQRTSILTGYPKKKAESMGKRQVDVNLLIHKKRYRRFRPVVFFFFLFFFGEFLWLRHGAGWTATATSLHDDGKL